MPADPPSLQVAARMEPDLVDRLDAVAELIGWSRTECFRRAVFLWVTSMETFDPDDPVDNVVSALLNENIRSTGDASDESLRTALRNARRRARDRRRRRSSSGPDVAMA